MGWSRSLGGDAAGWRMSASSLAWFHRTPACWFSPPPVRGNDPPGCPGLADPSNPARPLSSCQNYGRPKAYTLPSLSPHVHHSIGHGWGGVKAGRAVGPGDSQPRDVVRVEHVLVRVVAGVV